MCKEGAVRVRVRLPSLTVALGVQPRSRRKSNRYSKRYHLRPQYSQRHELNTVCVNVRTLDDGLHREGRVALCGQKVAHYCVRTGEEVAGSCRQPRPPLSLCADPTASGQCSRRPCIGANAASAGGRWRLRDVQIAKGRKRDIEEAVGGRLAGWRVAG